MNHPVIVLILSFAPCLEMMQHAVNTVAVHGLELLSSLANHGNNLNFIILLAVVISTASSSFLFL